MSEASNMIWDAIYNLQKGAKNTEQQVQPENVLPVCWNVRWTL